MRTENVVTTEDGATDQAPVREDMSAAVSRAIMRHAGRMLYKARWQLFPWAMIPIVFVAAQFWRTELFWTMFSTAVVLGLNGRQTSITVPAFERAGRWSVRHTGWVTIPYTIPSIPVPGLSQHEQRIWAVWLVAASTWAALEPLGVMAWWSLTAMVSAPSIAWMWSRRIRTPWWDPRYWALKRRMLWMRKHETTMHDWRLAGPTVTFKGGVTRFAIALPPGFHSGMVSETLRLKIETYFTKELGACIVDTGENNQRIHVKVAPLRGKFTANIKYQATQRQTPLEPVNIGVHTDGTQAQIPVAMTGGTRHIGVIGATGKGKSHTLELLLSGLAQTDIIIYLDGKRGGSMGDQMRASTIIATTDDEWRKAIRLAHKIMRTRQQIDGDDGHKQWDGQDHWPSLRVVIDEPSLVDKGLTRDERNMITDIATAGRSVAVALIICSQDIAEHNIPGAGATIRKQLVNGGVMIIMGPSEDLAERIPSLTKEAIEACRNIAKGEPGYGVVTVGGALDKRLIHTASTDQLNVTQAQPLDDVSQHVKTQLEQARARAQQVNLGDEPRSTTDEPTWTDQKPHEHRDEPTVDPVNPPPVPVRAGAREEPTDNPRDESLTAAQRVAAAEAQGAVTVGELMEATGLSRSSVKRHKTKAQEEAA